MASDATLSPTERLAKLRFLRERINGLLGEADTYSADLALQQEAEDDSQHDAVLAMREAADVREELLRRQLVTAAALDQAGLLSHEKLDELAERGQLEEAAIALGGFREWVEKLHPRGRGGRFVTKPGGGDLDGGPGNKDGLIKKVISKPGGRKHKVFKTSPVKPADLTGEGEHLASDIPPGMSAREFRALRGRRGKGKRGYEQRLEKLTKRIEKQVKRGSKRDKKEGRAGYGGTEPHFNANDKVSQRRLLDFVRAAASSPTTADQHSEMRNGVRVYHEDRKQLHEAIIKVMLNQRRWNPDANEGKGDWELCATCPPLEGVDEPEVTFSGGGYAAGKSSVVGRKGDPSLMPDSGYEGPPFILDPDSIKALLPEYQATVDGDPEANLLAYEEAWDIAQGLQKRAQERKLSMIVDGISDTSADEMVMRLQSFRDAGYGRMRVAYVDIPTEEALSRASHRARNAKVSADRRHIPEVILRSVHRDVASTVPELLGDERLLGLDVSIDVFNNHQGKDADGNFIPPKKFVSYRDGDMEVEDSELWESFLAKGSESIEGLTEAVLAEAELVEVDYESDIYALGEADYVFAETEEGVYPTPILEAWVLTEAGTSALFFDPNLHPRNRLGRFIEVVGSLRVGERLRTADGQEIERQKGRFQVSTSSGKTRNVRDAKSAAQNVLSRQEASPAPIVEVPVSKDAWPPAMGDVARMVFGDRYKVTFSEEDKEGRAPDGAALHTYIDDDGKQQLHAERAQVWEDIIRDIFKGKTPPPPDQRRRALFMGGGTASGKSSALEEESDLRPPKRHTISVDPDEIKKMLPEFQDMRGPAEFKRDEDGNLELTDDGETILVYPHADQYTAFGVHEESSALAKMVQHIAVNGSEELGIPGGFHLEIDGTGDSKPKDGETPGKFANKMIRMKEAGYQVDAFYVNAPTDEAVRRAMKRAEETGRYVPEFVIRLTHSSVSANFSEIAALPFLNSLVLYDTRERPPTVMGRREPGKQFQVEGDSEDWFQEFLDKQHERPVLDDTKADEA